MEEEVFDVPTYMLAKHESMLDAMEVVNPGRGGARPRRRRKVGQSPFSETEAVGSEKQVRKERKAQRVSTYDTSYQMFMNGLKPEDIARERGLTVGTIYGHLARFVSTGRLSADKVIDISKVKAIRHAISQLPEGASLSEVKAICRADITWNEIRLMMHDKG